MKSLSYERANISIEVSHICQLRGNDLRQGNRALYRQPNGLEMWTGEEVDQDFVITAHNLRAVIGKNNLARSYVSLSGAPKHYICPS